MVKLPKGHTVPVCSHSNVIWTWPPWFSATQQAGVTSSPVPSSRHQQPARANQGTQTMEVVTSQARHRRVSPQSLDGHDSCYPNWHTLTIHWLTANSSQFHISSPSRRPVDLCIDHGRSVVKVVPFLRQTRSVSRSEICSSLGELVSPGTVAGDHPDANSRMTKYRTIKGSSPFIPFPLRCQLQSRNSLLILFEMHFSTLKALK